MAVAGKAKAGVGDGGMVKNKVKACMVEPPPDGENPWIVIRGSGKAEYRIQKSE